MCASVLVTSFYTFRLMMLLFFSGEKNLLVRGMGPHGPYIILDHQERLYVYLALHLLGIASIKVGPYIHRSFVFVGAPAHRPAWFSLTRLVIVVAGGLLALLGNP